MKQSIEKCLSEYTTMELIQFHANLNALFLCCSTDFKLLPLLMQVHFAISEREEPNSKKYLAQVNKELGIPENALYRNSKLNQQL